MLSTRLSLSRREKTALKTALHTRTLSKEQAHSGRGAVPSHVAARQRTSPSPYSTDDDHRRSLHLALALSRTHAHATPMGKKGHLHPPPLLMPPGACALSPLTQARHHPGHDSRRPRARARLHLVLRVLLTYVSTYAHACAPSHAAHGHSCPVPEIPHGRSLSPPSFRHGVLVYAASWRRRRQQGARVFADEECEYRRGDDGSLSW
jgi:hypothetical protein